MLAPRNLAATTAIDKASVRNDLEAVERGLEVVREAMRREREATKPDKYDRVPAQMPTALRALYESGTWSDSPVYCWDLVASISAEGHEKAKAAEGALSRMSFRPPPGLADVAHTTLRAEHSPVVLAAASYSERIKDAVRDALEARRKARAEKVRKLSADYRDLRKAWLVRRKSDTPAPGSRQYLQQQDADRELVKATRALSGMGGGMADDSCDKVLAEIAAAGGTAGGVTRWGLSLATIPDQDTDYRAPDGGVLVDDPLAEHYAAKNVNPWTRAERLLFLEKFLSHSKNFRRIATFFEHKSVEDVVRFYFENKKPLKLKQLTKDGLIKRRATKKNALLELSRMPTEARSIKNNFAGEAASATMSAAIAVEDEEGDLAISYTASNVLGPPNASEASLMREAGKGWTPADQQALIFALCRHKIDDDFSSLEIPIVWCRVSHDVRTKSPAQCRQFYVHFKALLGLDKYQPPDVSSLRRVTPKRPRPADLARTSELEQRPASRPRQSLPTEGENEPRLPQMVAAESASGSNLKHANSRARSIATDNKDMDRPREKASVQAPPCETQYAGKQGFAPVSSKKSSDSNPVVGTCDTNAQSLQHFRGTGSTVGQTEKPVQEDKKGDVVDVANSGSASVVNAGALKASDNAREAQHRPQAGAVGVKDEDTPASAAGVSAKNLTHAISQPSTRTSSGGSIPKSKVEEGRSEGAAACQLAVSKPSLAGEAKPRGVVGKSSGDQRRTEGPSIVSENQTSRGACLEPTAHSNSAAPGGNRGPAADSENVTEGVPVSSDGEKAVDDVGDRKSAPVSNGILNGDTQLNGVPSSSQPAALLPASSPEVPNSVLLSSASASGSARAPATS